VFWQKEAKKTAVASRFNEAFVRKVENLIDMNLMGSSIGSGADRLVIIKLRGSNSVFTFPPPILPGANHQTITTISLLC
jgi:hypothetical protein